MKTKDMIHQLEGILENTEYQVRTSGPDDIFEKDAAALREAIKRIETPSDRFLANEILILAGLVLGAVGIISVLCGVIYILLGNYTAAWAMLPWAITAAVAALLAFGGVRK
ncbi:MAG: hypothetical protein LIO78_08405 [Clostridiales bacterium]|nr:hypothetical protein [Clostridiales bacterium]MCC8100063.1 hypothetical protein [Clostridiales bacterium]